MIVSVWGWVFFLFKYYGKIKFSPLKASRQNISDRYWVLYLDFVDK